MGVTHYFIFHNHERQHQLLSYPTPNVVYQSATGGSAKIVDKFGGTQKNWERHAAAV